MTHQNAQDRLSQGDRQIFTTSVKRLFRSERRDALRCAVEQFVEVVFEERYHFSDVLHCLADYAEREREARSEEPRSCVVSSGDQSPEDGRAWDTVAALLEAAAVEAETKGRELP